MRVQQEPGFVLHKRPYSESSWLVDVFALRYGRFSMLAKGARRTKSKLRGTLQPFQALLLGWAGRGNLPVLVSAEAASCSPPLKGSAIHCGFYINELVIRLLPTHDPHPLLFEMYARTLQGLSEAPAQELHLRRFEKTLLKELGYGLALDVAADTREPIDRASRYRYIPERGAFKIKPGDCAGLCVQGSTLLAIAKEEWPSRQDLLESKRLMRAVLGHLLGGRPLHSRRIFITQRERIEESR